MRCVMLSLAVAVVLLATGGVRADGFFNGKDLDGFEGITSLWSVKDGALVGNSGPDGLKFNTFLCSKNKSKDFELKFQVRLKGGAGNSGIQIRSEIVANEKDKFVVRGPQCDIGAEYWGSLYGERFNPKTGDGSGGMMQAAPKEVVTKVVKKDDFNDYHIKCVGKHVTIKVNGETTVDADFPVMPEEGIIAFQLHGGGPMEVTFKNIEFKDLSKK